MCRESLILKTNAILERITVTAIIQEPCIVSRLDNLANNLVVITGLPTHLMDDSGFETDFEVFDKYPRYLRRLDYNSREGCNGADSLRRSSEKMILFI